MGFLVITMIGPVTNFLGVISLRVSMLIMGALIIVCSGYSYLEAKVFFENTKLFGLINISLYAAIEAGIALLIFLDYFTTKKRLTILLYLLTIGLTGMTLVYNIFKISLFDDKIKEYKINHKYFQFMFFIRIGAEFIIQLIVCYMVYSYKKSL